MSDTYDPDAPFSLDEDPEDVLRRLLGAEEPAEGSEENEPEEP